MSPLYQTEEQVSAELALGQRATAPWGATVRKRGTREDPDEVDFDVLCGDHVCAVLEVKDRSRYQSTSFPTLMIDKAKIEALLRESIRRWVPGFLAVQWSDRLGVARVREGFLGWEGKEPAGRTDRGDPYDRDRVLYIPTSQFVHPTEMMGWLPWVSVNRR